MEVDAGEVDVTVKVFHSGVKSCQSLALCAADASVQLLVNLIHEKFQFPPAQYSLVPVHRGHRLQLTSLLSDNNIKNGSCVNVIVSDLKSELDAVSTSRLEGATVLRRLFGPTNQYITKNVLTNSNTINELMCKLPSLSADLVAQGILKNFRLMQTIVNSDTINSLLEKHPCMAEVAAHLSEIVLSQSGTHNIGYATARSETNRYALDAMSDEEEETDVPIQRITTGQLSAAIALAQVSNEPTSSTNSPAATSQAAASAPTKPTNTAGQSTSSQGQTTTRAEGSDVKYEQELEQLLTLGITDRELALRSLEASGGNVNLALDIIYGGDI